MVKQVMSMLSGGADRPIRRLLTYYLFLGIVVFALHSVWPGFDARMTGSDGGGRAVDTPTLLQDGLQPPPEATGVEEFVEARKLILSVFVMLLGTVVLMLPVSWVYMYARNTRGHNQAVAQTLIILPIVVAGIVMIVQDSLALAFSLAGVVAAVRFRTTLKDARDTVYIFLAIAVGFAAGVQSLTIGALLSLFFNLVVLITWRYDFGRNVLETTTSSKWVEPLGSLATVDTETAVPDRDLMMALTPETAGALATKFERVSELLGSKKARFNGVLRITTDKLADCQRLVEKELAEVTKRWQLDQVVTAEGKPSELYYLIKLRKTMSSDDLLTALRGRAGGVISNAVIEAGETLARAKDEE